MTNLDKEYSSGYGSKDGSGHGYGHGSGLSNGHGFGHSYGNGHGHGDGDGSGAGDGTEEKRKEIERIILKRIPDNDLPLYLNIWEFPETRTLLEKKLKNNKPL